MFTEVNQKVNLETVCVWVSEVALVCVSGWKCGSVSASSSFVVDPCLLSASIKSISSC